MSTEISLAERFLIHLRLIDSSNTKRLRIVTRNSGKVKLGRGPLENLQSSSHE